MNSFFKNKKILITGADGFIGSHLTEQLIKTEADIKALSYYNSFNYWGWLENIEGLDKIKVVSGDIRDSRFCQDIMTDVEVVFHLAALIGIPYSYIAPSSYIDTNVNGTLNICQAALDKKVSRIVHTSTSEVYGTAVEVPIKETHSLNAQSPYSASKIGADAIAQGFYNSFDLPLIIARPFNTYGPRQSARAVIPTIITQISSGKKKIRLGDLSPTRDFTYVIDICKALMALAACDNATGKTVNIGSNFEISIKDIFDKINGLMGADAEYVDDDLRHRPENSEVQRLWCDNSKLVELTGFAPEIDFDRGLKMTIEWFSDLSNLAGYKEDIYNV